MQRALGDVGLGGKFRKRGRPVPHNLRDKEGKLVNGREELDKLWMDHFGQMEHGRVVDVRDFLQQSSDVEFLANDILDTASIPTKMEIERVFREVPIRKAIGLDLCRRHTRTAAAPLNLTRIDLVSGRSAGESLPESHTTEAGRIAAKTLAPPAQWAEARSPCDVASNCGSSLNRLFRAKGVSAAIFCLDTKSAYYRTIRQLAVGQLSSEEQTVRIFQEFGLDPRDYHEFLELTRQGGAMGEAGPSSHLLAMSQDLYQRTWFMSNYTGGQKVCQVQAGSRPGASCADVLFGFIYGRLLSKVREEAANSDFNTPLQYTGSRTLLVDPEARGREVVRVSDATWPDDSTMVTFDASPRKLMVKAVKIMETVIHQCVRYGLKHFFCIWCLFFYKWVAKYEQTSNTQEGGKHIPKSRRHHHARNWTHHRETQQLVPRYVNEYLTPQYKLKPAEILQAMTA